MLKLPEMTVEVLAVRHLGLDLRSAEYWEKAVRMVVEDINRFLELTQK